MGASVICPEEISHYLHRLLGDYAWRYDINTVLDLTTRVAPVDGRRHLLGEDEMPVWEDIADVAMRPVNVDSVDGIRSWAGCEGECDRWAIFNALVQCELDGRLVWKGLKNQQVREVVAQHTGRQPRP